MPVFTLSLSFSLFWALACLPLLSVAQTSRLFQWGFGNDFLSTSLPTCTPLPIVVKSWDFPTNSTMGTPPYYMQSFSLGATPVSTLLGTTNDNLSWTVTQPVGSKLVLLVVDANKSSGGVAPRVFTVIAGQTTNCVKQSQSTPEFKITTNITGDLSTCQPWGFSITGGVPPYTITLLQPNQPVVTNATIAFGDDHFTFINRADPGNSLVGAISDFTGRWANGAAMVNTKGSSNTACTGLVSSSGNTTIINQQIRAAEAASDAAKKQGRTVIAVVVTLLLLLLIGAGVGVYFYFRRRQRIQEVEDAKVMPDQFLEPKPEPALMSINNYLSDDVLPPLPSKAQEARGVVMEYERRPSPPSFSEVASSFSPPNSEYRGRSAPSSVASSGDRSVVARSSASGGTDGVGRTASANGARPGFTSFPSRSIRRGGTNDSTLVVHPKEAEAIRERQLAVRSPETEFPEIGIAGSGSDGESTTSRTGLISRKTTTDSETSQEDVPVASGSAAGTVIQHQDGGAVRELPPPYKDSRNNGSGDR